MNLSSHAVAALIRNEQGEILLLKESRQLFKGVWAPPHGRSKISDKSEDVSIVREVKEETNLDVRPIRRLLTQAASAKTKTVSFWLVDVVGGDLILDSKEASESGWFHLEEALKLELYPGTREFLEKVKAGEISLEF